MTTATVDTIPALSEAERRRALGEVYAYLLNLAAKRRAAQATMSFEPTQPEASDNDDHREIPES